MKSNGWKTKSKAILNSQLIPPGYKQTEVGVIPEDWNLARLTSIADVRDGTHESPKYIKNGVPFVTSKNILGGKIDLQDITFISQEDADEVNKRSKVDRGDILMSMIGTVGNAALVDFEPDFCIKNVALIKPIILKVEPQFLIQVFRSSLYGRYIDNKLDGGIQKFISLGMLRGLDVPLPPTKAEQEAIARVLGNADALIESLEQLIAAKTEFKHGLLQQLLTGRKRFKEFKGQDWRQYHLGDLAIESELRNNGRLTEKSLYAVTKAYGMIPMRERVQGESVERCKVVSKDWFAYNPMRLNIGSIAKWNTEDDVLVSPDYVVFRCDETRLDPDFLNHYRRSHRWAKFVEKAGDGSVRVRIWFSHLAELKLSLPPLPEQRRIAAVLNACDRELDLLREQLVEFKKQKQGLMQKLLTGQIRVKVDEAQAIGV